MSVRPQDRGCAVRPAQRGVAGLPELGRRGGLIAGSCGRCVAGIATSLPGREPLRTASRNLGETAAAPGDRTGGLTASEPTHGGLPPVRYRGYSRHRLGAVTPRPCEERGIHAGSADGCRPRPARQDHRLRGLTARRHLTNVLSRIVPRWIASCFLPRTSGTKGGRFGARSARGRSARTRPPMKQACLRLPARVHLAVTGGALLRAATAAMRASSAAPLAPGTRSLKAGLGFWTTRCHYALLSGAGADPSARGERRHQCRASDGGFVRGFSLDLDEASLRATPLLARRRRNETVTRRSKQ
jgi:hypothetical protein